MTQPTPVRKAPAAAIIPPIKEITAPIREPPAATAKPPASRAKIAGHEAGKNCEESGNGGSAGNGCAESSQACANGCEGRACENEANAAGSETQSSETGALANVVDYAMGSAAEEGVSIVIGCDEIDLDGNGSSSGSVRRRTRRTGLFLFDPFAATRAVVSLNPMGASEAPATAKAVAMEVATAAAR